MFDIFNMTTEQANMLNDLHIPKDYYTNKTLVYQFWFRSLLHKINSSIIFTGLPKGWDKDYFLWVLYMRGYVTVFKSELKELNIGSRKVNISDYGENGILFAACYAAGQDFYYQPTDITIVNPYYIPAKPLVNHVQAELIKLTPDYMGVYDIITRYAEELAELSKGIDMSIINTKFALVFTAENEAQSATLKAVVDSIQSGSPVTFYKDTNSEEIIPTKEPFSVFNQEIVKNFILDRQLECMDHILNQFYTEIGISSSFSVEKKERLVTAEAEFAGAQSQARITCWLNSLNSSIERVNKKFGTNIGVAYACEDNTDTDGSAAESDREVDNR